MLSIGRAKGTANPWHLAQCLSAGCPRWFVCCLTTVPAGGPSAEWFDTAPASSSACGADLALVVAALRVLVFGCLARVTSRMELRTVCRGHWRAVNQGTDRVR